MNQNELLKYLSDTMKWANDKGITFKGVIEEIALAGFTNEEVGMMMKEICMNPTFKIKTK
mgnify:CR=1 FL=1